MTRIGACVGPVAGLVATMGLAACAAHVFVRPAGPPVVAPDAGRAWTDARAACRSVPGYAASLGLTGKLGDRRVRGMASARLEAAVTATGQMALEARVSGQLLFKLGGTSDRAVLLLAADHRVVTAPAAEIVDALVGVPLGPDRLLAMMTGCVSISNDISRTGRYGHALEIVTSDAVVFLESGDGAWRVRAGTFGDFAVDYLSFDRGMPRRIALRSTQGHAPAVFLSLDATSVDLSGGTPLSAFSVNIPDDASPMSIEELRQSGPLGPDAAR